MNDERSGRPTTDNIEKIHEILKDCRIKVRETAGISKERVCHILTEELDMRKLTARWLPLVHCGWKTHSNEYFQLPRPYWSGLDETSRISRLITVNENWIHYFLRRRNSQNSGENCEGWICSEDGFIDWEGDGDYFLRLCSSIILKK